MDIFLLSNSRLFKSICLILVFAFVVQDISFANPDLKPIEWSASLKPAFHFKLPESVAVTGDAHRSFQSRRTLILIQDPHTNNSGQLNIAKVLDIIFQSDVIAGKSFRYVFLEAGAGDGSLSFLRQYAPEEARKRAAEYFLRRGKLQGSEYANLVLGHDFILWGVEDMKLYAESVGVYHFVAKKRERFEDYLSRIESTIKVLRPKVLNPILLTFEGKYEKYQKGESTLTEYFDFLAESANKLGIHLSRYPHLKILKKFRELEFKIDFRKTNAEQEKALSLFSGVELKELYLASKQNRSTARLSNENNPVEQAFFSLLHEKIKDRRSEFPELTKYLFYRRHSAKINARLVIKEEANLEADILKALATSLDEEELVRASRNVARLRKLLELTLTPEEFDDYKKRKKSYDITRITGFLNKKIMDLKDLYEDAVFLENGYEDVITKCEEFYELTYERDKKFVQNLAEKMEAENQEKAVLVAGGYHTPNLKYLLEQKDIAYVVVTPQVYHETNHKRYEKLLLGQNVERLKRSPSSSHSKLGLVGARFAHAAGTSRTFADLLEYLQVSPELATREDIASGAAVPSGVKEARMAGEKEQARRARRRFKDYFYEEIKSFAQEKDIWRVVYWHWLFVGGKVIVFYTKAYEQGQQILLKDYIHTENLRAEIAYFGNVILSTLSIQVRKGGWLFLQKAAEGVSLEEMGVALKIDLEVVEALGYALGELHGVGLNHGDLARPGFLTLCLDHIFVHQGPDGKRRVSLVEVMMKLQKEESAALMKTRIKYLHGIIDDFRRTEPFSELGWAALAREMENRGLEKMDRSKLSSWVYDNAADPRVAEIIAIVKEDRQALIRKIIAAVPPGELTHDTASLIAGYYQEVPSIIRLAMDQVHTAFPLKDERAVVARLLDFFGAYSVSPNMVYIFFVPLEVGYPQFSTLRQGLYRYIQKMSTFLEPSRTATWLTEDSPLAAEYKIPRVESIVNEHTPFFSSLPKSNQDIYNRRFVELQSLRDFALGVAAARLAAIDGRRVAVSLSTDVTPIFDIRFDGARFALVYGDQEILSIDEAAVHEWRKHTSAKQARQSEALGARSMFRAVHSRMKLPAIMVELETKSFVALDLSQMDRQLKKEKDFGEALRLIGQIMSARPGNYYLANRASLSEARQKLVKTLLLDPKRTTLQITEERPDRDTVVTWLRFADKNNIQKTILAGNETEILSAGFENGQLPNLEALWMAGEISRIYAKHAVDGQIPSSKDKEKFDLLMEDLAKSDSFRVFRSFFRAKLTVFKFHDFLTGLMLSSKRAEWILPPITAYLEDLGEALKLIRETVDISA